MNSRPFAGARYSTHHMGMGFELADEGEVYMICQGTGGGYGDVLERDPEAVMADVEAGYLSSEAAREIYFVVHDPDTLAVDVAGTEAARAAERQARLRRGRPYAEFVKAWATPEPPAHLPYYGSWGDDNSIIHATAWTTHGPVRVAAPVSQLPQIFLPDPNVVALAVQQARIAELETRARVQVELRPGDGVMSRLLASLDAPPSGRARPVWFDAAAYGRARLLGGGDVPWPSPAELSSFFAKIGGNVPLRRDPGRPRGPVRSAGRR